MSQLLTALKKSDANNAIQSGQNDSNVEPVKIVHPMRAVKAQQLRPKWIVPIMIALLPAALIVAYKFYQQQPSMVTRTTNHPLAVADAQKSPLLALTDTVLQPPKKQTLVPAVTAEDVVFMTYPQLVTEPLPISDSLYTASPAYQSSDYNNVSQDNVESEAQYKNLGPTYDDTVIKPIHRASKASPAPQDPYGLDNLDLSGLAPDIAAKLKSAIVATNGEQYQDSEVDRSADDRDAPVAIEKVTPKSKVFPIGLLPSTVQRQLPKMNFNQHIYSLTPAKRWVKVNGHERHQGDTIAPGVKLVKIEARDVILAFDGYEISMPALSEW